MSTHIHLKHDQESVSATPAASPFKGPDGLLNFDACKRLNDRVDAAKKALEAKGMKVPVLEYYVMAIKAKPIKYSASLDKKDDAAALKYHTRRATKIAVRKRMAPGAETRAVVVMTNVDKSSGIPAALLAQVKEAVRAIKSHMLKSVKSKDRITKVRGKQRDADATTFAGATNHLKSILVAGGIKDTDIVESQGMFGKTVLVKLSPEYVVSIGKSDIKRFNAAKRDAKSAEGASTSSDFKLYEWAKPMMKVITFFDKDKKAKAESIASDDGAYISAGMGKQIVNKFRSLGYKVTEKPKDYFIIQSKLEPKAGLLIEFREEELEDGEGMCRLNFQQF